jgi:hypothetical protein
MLLVASELRDRLAAWCKAEAGHRHADLARRQIERIRKAYKHALDTRACHDPHHRGFAVNEHEAMERKLREATEEALNDIEAAVASWTAMQG